MSLTGSGRSTSPVVPPLSERYRRILSLVVREFIEHGEPVSSLWLATHSGLGLSSATVRNMLARLEELGYVRQPHTSAGRVPTDLGYRTYVDTLLDGRRPSLRSTAELEARLRHLASIDEVLDGASHEVARASHYAAFVLAPASEHIGLRQIEFVALGASRVLVVLIATDGRVSQKPVELLEAVSPADLMQAATYLNREFAGRDLADIRREIGMRLHEDRVLYDQLLSRALHLASASLADFAPQSQLFVHGVSTLVDETQTTDGGIPMGALRALLGMIEEKHRMILLLNEYVEGPGLTVVIGAEHNDPALRNVSLVATTTVDEGRTHTIGVLGPTRMRYSRAIAAVETTSLAVGRVLDATP